MLQTFQIHLDIPPDGKWTEDYYKTVISSLASTLAGSRFSLKPDLKPSIQECSKSLDGAALDSLRFSICTHSDLKENTTTLSYRFEAILSPKTPEACQKYLTALRQAYYDMDKQTLVTLKKISKEHFARDIGIIDKMVAKATDPIALQHDLKEKFRFSIPVDASDYLEASDIQKIEVFLLKTRTEFVKLMAETDELTPLKIKYDNETRFSQLLQKAEEISWTQSAYNRKLGTRLEWNLN